jgi:hypothetical protein
MSASIERIIPKKAKNIMINPVNSNFQNKDNKAKRPDCDLELNVPCDIEKSRSNELSSLWT